MRDMFIIQQVRTFIERLRVVEERQVKAFFADQGRNETEYALRWLKDQNYVHAIPNTTRIASDLRYNNINNYDYSIDAVDVMVQLLRSKDVNWYSLRDLPFELEFIFNDFTTLATVSVFDRHNWKLRYDLTKRMRSLTMPEGEEDPRKHIALVSDESLIEKIEPLGFEMFVRIKDRATGELEKWTYE